MRTSRLLVTTAVLAAIQVAMIVSGLTTVPLPNALNVTVLAIPATLAGVLAGWISGGAVGAAFGLTSFALATTALFQNPIVAIVPRILIGPIAALVFRLSRRTNEVLAFVFAGAAGAVAKTGLVLILAALLPGPTGGPYLPPDAAQQVALRGLPWEALVAAVATLAIGLASRVAMRNR
jgi:uncharacterized membrane protein